MLTSSWNYKSKGGGGVIGLYVALAVLIFIEAHLLMAWPRLPIRPKDKIRRIAALGKIEQDIWSSLMNRISAEFHKGFPEGLPWGRVHLELIKRRLEEARLPQSAELYLFKKCFCMMMTLIIGGVLALLTRDVKPVSYFFTGCAGVLSLMAFRVPDQELSRIKEKRDEQIILELPRFIRTVRYSPGNKPLIAVVRDYLKIAKGGLRADLQILLGDLELNITEERALQDFSDRMGLAEVREMVAVLRVTLNASRKESLISLIFIEDKLTEKAKQLVQRDLDRRPEILETLNDLLLYALGLIFLVPMAITMLTGLSAFMG